MDARTVELYLARAAAAATVRDLHAVVRDLRRAHPAAGPGGDPDAERVERACWDRALGLLRSTTAAPRPARAAARSGADWKEQAARMGAA